MFAFTTLGDGIDALKRIDTAIPEIGAEEILVKITAVSLNYRDLLVIKGVGHWKPKAPRIPISDGVGKIVGIGSNVTKWAVGERVIGTFLPYWTDAELTDEKYIVPLGGAAADGVLAEYVKFSQEAVVKAPDNLSDKEAATLPVAALTAWHAVALRSKIQPNDTVVIQGTGGVSLFALQFVTSLGGLPILTSGSDEKLSQLASLGAFATINYTTFPDWEQKVLELTNGKGANHIIEVVGGENLNRSLVAVKLSGTISFIGLIAGLHGSINTYQFVNKNVNIYGIETGSRAMFEEMNRFIDQHRIKPVISAEFDIADIHHALKMLERGSHLGKIVISLPD